MKDTGRTAHRPRDTAPSVRAPGAAVAVAAALALPATGPAAQEIPPELENPAPLTIPKIDGPIELDGRLDDDAWGEAAVLPPVAHVPDFGAEPTERTEFLVAHDGEHLYFGCRAWDSDPDGIQALSLQRNASGFIHDWCTLSLDTLNDGETALVFSTTPAGIRTDALAPNDATTGLNFDWDTFWDAAAAQTREGWFAEVRIPFSSLAFQEDEGRVVMGLATWRHVARKNESVTHPAISPRSGDLSPFKASQMRPVVLEGVEAPRAAHVTPYVLGGTGHSHARAGDGSGFDRASERVGEAGLDVRYGLGPNFNLDLTVNTDFAQVEADDQQVNLDRFSLFFPEKRRFFQERGAVFEFPLGGQERLFHSRRVGLADGEPVRIYGGGRLVGRVGEWDLGALNMQTAESDALPSENHGVVRARRRVLNENSYLGGIVTSRVGGGGHYNVVYGADAVLRLLERDYLTVNWAQSFDDAEEEAAGDVGPLDRSLVRVRWERREIYGPLYEVELTRAGSAFEPGMGFLQRRDYAQGDLRLGYGWDPGPGSSLFRYAVEVTTSAVRRNRDGVLETGSVEPSVTVRTGSGRRFTATARHLRENLERGFDLSSGAHVPAGRHHYTEGTLEYRPPSGDLLQWSARLEGGGFFDGTRRSVEVEPSWRPSRHLGLSAAYLLDRVAFAERDQRFTAHVGRVRSEIMLSPELSAVAFVQYNSELDLLASNLRFRYNPREGDDLYIVWNEGVNTSPHRYDPARPRSEERTLLLKYSRTFSLTF